MQALIQSKVPIREVRLERSEFEGLTAESRSGVYDLSCVDESGRHFIVEMQVAHSPHFLQRLKFYAFHKLNELVERGNFQWEGLAPIYCIALLSRSILPGSDYRTVANLRSEAGELLDPQLTFVFVELDKFAHSEAAVHTDLEKLIFTMQTLDKAPFDPKDYPAFWEEEWLSAAIERLSTRNMTAAQRSQFARVIARRADLNTELEERRQNAQAKADLVVTAQALEQTAQALEQTEQALEQAEQALEQTEQALEQTEQARQQAAQALKATALNLLQTGRFTAEEVAAFTSSTLEQVRRWQAEA